MVKQAQTVDSGNPVEPPYPHTSEMLFSLLQDNANQTLTLSELTAGLMNRVLGFIMIIFAIPCIIPMPPGIPFLCGIVLLSCGVHLLVGRETLWLPQRIGNKGINRSIVERTISYAVPIAYRLEKYCHPRWAWLTSQVGRAFIGAMVTVQALILLLPIPILGSLPPGVAIAVLAFGLIERDGLVIFLGFVVSIVAIVVTSTIGWATIQGLLWLV